MPHQEVKKNIEELKDELGRTSQETNALEEKLEQAKDGIERYTPEAVQELAQFLQKETAEFEVDHPRITALVNQVMTSLSNLGI